MTQILMIADDFTGGLASGGFSSPTLLLEMSGQAKQRRQ